MHPNIAAQQVTPSCLTTFSPILLCMEAVSDQPAKRAKTDGWQANHAELWRALPSSQRHSDSAKWSFSRNLLLVSGKREQDVIDYAWAIEEKNGHEGLFIDVSQSASRRPWSRGLRSMVSSSSFYSYESDRQLVGAEHLLLLGWTESIVGRFPSTLTQARLKCLAGEAMSLPCVALVLVSVLTALDVWRPA